MLEKKTIYNELEKLQIHEYCCFIYESEEEWRDSMIPFMIQGLMNGEKCIYVQDKRDADYIYQSLQDEGIDINSLTCSGQLMIVDSYTIFGDQPANDIEQIISIYSNWMDLFLAEGFTSIRFSSEIHFGLFDYEPYGKFLELLMRLNRDFFPYYPLKTICQYHRYEEDSTVLRDAIIASGWILRAGHHYRNPSSISPERYFNEKHTGWEAEYWLGTQEALVESEERYRQIVEHSLDMITILDINSYNISFISPSNYEILGFPAEEVIGHNVMEFIHPDHQQQILADIKKGIILGQGEGPGLLRKKDGSYIWTEGKGTLIRKPTGEDEIIIFSREVHAKKLAEEALWNSEQKYKNQVDYLNTLINTMNELCLTYDRDVKLTFVNQRLSETLGFSNEEMLGKSVLDFIPENSKDSVQAQISRRLDKGEISCHENTLRCKDGSELLVKLKGSPIIENDTIVGALVLAEDISQQHRLEKDMARLGQLNMIGEIAASIGHEVRNPMTTVQGFLQLLSRNQEFQNYNSYFDLMIEELNRANAIITEFLALGKDKVVNLQQANINKILETMAPLLLADALKADKNINFELKNVAEVFLDEQEIRQLILNLVRNGLEAMSEGGTLFIRTKMTEGEVVLSVQDEGTGIPPEVMDKLGTPFLSTKENGTGLGLAVCYSIANRHQAKIIVDSCSTGSIFHVHFTAGTQETLLL